MQNPHILDVPSGDSLFFDPFNFFTGFIIEKRHILIIGDMNAAIGITGQRLGFFI